MLGRKISNRAVKTVVAHSISLHNADELAQPLRSASTPCDNALIAVIQ
ncbi:MAG: hypothetical protein OXE59_13150 [Bacteroidetes bacterium]|nr:hypothetical protein [Bacteroidota bacterium]MCY4234670.1 hypothetical protein [Bacteroidota bacterium]